MILEIDIGNSRLKWRTLSAGDSQLIDEGHSTELDQLLTEHKAKYPKFVRFCNVRDRELSEQLCAWSLSNWNLEAAEAKVSRECAGLRINYLDESRLGVDRWLAMLAALNFNNDDGSDRATLIVDSGTAFTLDSISATGNHLGGYILPGLKLMRSSLVNNTGIRLAESANSDSIALGNSTEEAVLNGILATFSALIEKQYAALEKTGETPRVLFSGGDAGLLNDLVDLKETEIVPNLVLDGLAIACPVPDGMAIKG